VRFHRNQRLLVPFQYSHLLGSLYETAVAGPAAPQLLRRVWDPLLEWYVTNAPAHPPRRSRSTSLLHSRFVPASFATVAALPITHRATTPLLLPPPVVAPCC